MSKECSNIVEGTENYSVKYGCGNVTNMYGEKILCNKCKKDASSIKEVKKDE